MRILFSTSYGMWQQNRLSSIHGIKKKFSSAQNRWCTSLMYVQSPYKVYIMLNEKYCSYILHKLCTETCKKYSVIVIFYYIFHIKPQFFKTLFQSQLLFDFDEIFTNRIENSFCDYFKLFFGSTDFKYSWFKHKLFVFKCTIIVLCFRCSKFSFVFKSWIDYKIMIKSKCKTTFNSVFIG